MSRTSSSSIFLVSFSFVVVRLVSKFDDQISHKHGTPLTVCIMIQSRTQHGFGVSSRFQVTFIKVSCFYNAFKILFHRRNSWMKRFFLFIFGFFFLSEFLFLWTEELCLCIFIIIKVDDLIRNEKAFSVVCLLFSPEIVCFSVGDIVSSRHLKQIIHAKLNLILYDGISDEFVTFECTKR